MAGFENIIRYNMIKMIYIGIVTNCIIDVQTISC